MKNEVYFLAQLDVKDFKEYLDEYAKPVLGQFLSEDAEVLVATNSAEIIEGDSSNNWTVVVKFPSKESALNWYNSESYSPLKDTRINKLTNNGNLFLLPAFDISALS